MKKVFIILGMALLATACQPQAADNQRQMESRGRMSGGDEMPAPKMRDGRSYMPHEERRGVYNPNDLNGRNQSRARMSETGGTTPGRYTPRYE